MVFSPPHIKFVLNEWKSLIICYGNLTNNLGTNARCKSILAFTSWNFYWFFCLSMFRWGKLILNNFKDNFQNYLKFLNSIKVKVRELRSDEEPWWFETELCSINQIKTKVSPSLPGQENPFLPPGWKTTTMTWIQLTIQ